MKKVKKKLGYEAARLIESGMVIGLGSGTTVNCFIEELSTKVQKGLNVKAVPSSKKSEKLALQLKIPLIELQKDTTIDLAVDGTDEFDQEFNLLKGGGGSLVREKIVINSAEKVIIIAEESKQVNYLGAFNLPVEILQFGWEKTVQSISQLGSTVMLRKNNGKTFVSDNGNFIVDCNFGKIKNPIDLHKQLKSMVGVVETGLFINMVDCIFIGNNDRVYTKYKD